MSARVIHRVIQLHAQAPAKPAPGSDCNGCGVCCAAEPCPLGQWLSGRRRGACVALTWREPGQRYACGLLDDPGRWLPPLPSPWARALARRWIAAGRGCDSDFEAFPAPAQGDQAPSTR